MRYTDILFNQGWRHPISHRTIPAEAINFLKEEIALYTVIEATNVYEYLQGAPGEDLYELPCAAPPEPLLILEWRQRNGKGILLHAVANDAKEEPFIIGSKVPDKTPGANGYRKLRGGDDGNRGRDMWLSDHLPNQLAWNRVRWTWMIDMFQEDSGSLYGAMSCTRAALNEWGELIDVTYESHIPANERELQALSLHPFAVFLHTLNFMQCANIQTEYIEPSEKLSHKHRKKGHIKDKLIGYHVLRIATKGPATKTRGSGNGRGDGLVAFHPVRGEFHHYGDCCPGKHPPKGLMFGKHTGRFWVPSHVRGNPERGSIVRDFEVKPVTEVPWRG